MYYSNRRLVLINEGNILQREYLCISKNDIL